jgi:hypothetical protein
MNASDRIVEEFNRLVAIGQDRIPDQPHAERVVYFVVATRCEIDMEGFASVFEQAFKPSELRILVEGLHSLGEKYLADEFARGFELLRLEGFYDHMNWNRVSAGAKQQIAQIGERIGDRLWGLDEKLAALLDAEADRKPSLATFDFRRRRFPRLPRFCGGPSRQRNDLDRTARDDFDRQLMPRQQAHSEQRLIADGGDHHASPNASPLDLGLIRVVGTRRTVS